MNSVVAQIETLDETLASAVRETFATETIPDLAGEDIAALLVATGKLQRRIEALQVEAAVRVSERPRGFAMSDSLRPTAARVRPRWCGC